MNAAVSKIFHDALKATAEEMLRGEHPEYDQSRGTVCRVGITLKAMGVPIERNLDTYQWIQDFTGKKYDSPLHTLYSTVSSRDRDQKTGARGIYKYLKEIEYV